MALNSDLITPNVMKIAFYGEDINDMSSTTLTTRDISFENAIVLNHTDEQGFLFDNLMKHIIELQRNITTSQSVIIYKTNGESGLGNVIIGMVSSLISGLATDRGFQSMLFWIL